MRENRKRPLLIFGFSAFLLFLATCGVDRWMAPKNKKKPAVQRWLRLHEHPPGMRRKIKAQGPFSPGHQGEEGKIVDFRADDQGFLLPAKIHKKPDWTVVVLGGSTAECRDLPESQRWPAQLSEIFLKKHNRKVNVLNAGIKSGHILGALNLFLNKIAPMRPNYILFMPGPGELEKLLRDELYWKKDPRNPQYFRYEERTVRWGSVMKDAFSMIWPQIVARWSRPAPLKVPIERPAKFEESDATRVVVRYERMVRLFLQATKAFELPVFVVTQPHRLVKEPGEYEKKTVLGWTLKTGISYFQFRDFYATFNQKLVELANPFNAPVIHLSTQIPGNEKNFLDMFQLSAVGSKRAAEYAANLMIEHHSNLRGLNKKQRLLRAKREAMRTKLLRPKPPSEPGVTGVEDRRVRRRRRRSRRVKRRRRRRNRDR